MSGRNTWVILLYSEVVLICKFVLFQGDFIQVILIWWWFYIFGGFNSLVVLIPRFLDLSLQCAWF